MKSIFSLVLLGLMTLSFNVSASEGLASLDKYQWKRVRDINNIEVFMKHRDESRIKSFLATSIIKAEDPYAIAAVFEDFPAAPDWMHMMSEVTEINRISDSKRDVRLETRLPWPLKDRDTAVNAVITQNKETFDVTISMTQDDSLLPEYPGYIRMPEIQGTIRAKFLSEQRMYIEMEFLLDAGGYVPPWATNIVLKDISYHTLRKLSKILLREKYQGKKEVYISWLQFPELYHTDEYSHPNEAAIIENKH